MKVSRREATSSASIVISGRAPATVHISITSVTHALSHIELMGSDITEAPGETASRTTSSTPPSVRPLVKAPTAAAGAAVVAAVAEASAMPVMGVVDAATANIMHARLNASATAAQRPRRDKRATWTAMGGDTRER
jgi:hypothetical protein